MFEHAGEFCLAPAPLSGGAIGPAHCRYVDVVVYKVEESCRIIMERDFVDSKLESGDI